MRQVQIELSAPANLESEEDTGFGGSIVRAGMVTLGTHVFGQFLRLCGNLILTRLLLPEAFGVMLVANVLSFGLTLLTDLGFRQIVVRSPHAGSREFLDTVWSLQILQGIAIATLLVGAAGLLPAVRSFGLLPASSTFSSPELPMVLGWLAVAALLTATESTKLHMATRNMQVARLAALEIGSQAVALSVTVLWARATGGVGALVGGACISAACRTAATHLLLHGERNRLRWDAAAVREVFSFGAPILLTSCAGFLISGGDKLLLGWVLPTQAMGAYAIAVLLVNASHDAAGKLIGQVAYPAMSRAYARDPGSLRGAYLQVRRKTDAGCLVVAGLLAGCGERIVAWLYDARYAQAGTYLCILALSLIGVRYRVLSHVLLVIGRPRLMLYEQITQILSLVPGIFLGFRLFGVIGAMWGVALSYVFAQVWNVFYLQGKLGLLSRKLELQGVAVFAIAAVIGRLIASLP
jgi:O-antigen/teichoic acid export membrane protein